MVSCFFIKESKRDLDHLRRFVGKKDEKRGHMLEVELNTLDPKNFDTIHDLFNKFKYLILNSSSCGIDKSKEVDQLILTILAKIGLG
jgi:hypothetical protein